MTMKHGSRGTEDGLSRVEGEFERWRRSRRPGMRIPESLWRAAVAAGREHGISKTARELRLDYYSLKDRVESACQERLGVDEARESGFLEIPLCLPPSSAEAECVLEIEDGQGGRLRVELRGAALSRLETLAQAVLGVAR